MGLTETPWAIVILVGLVWLVVSCVFCVGLGRFLRRFKGERVREAAQAGGRDRQGPRRAGNAAPSRRHEPSSKTSTG